MIKLRISSSITYFHCKWYGFVTLIASLIDLGKSLIDFELVWKVEIVCFYYFKFIVESVELVEVVSIELVEGVSVE